MKEVAEMTAFSKYKGHISAQNTGLSILLTVCTKRLYLRDVCSREKGGQRKGKKKGKSNTEKQSQGYSQNQPTKKVCFD